MRLEAFDEIVASGSCSLDGFRFIMSVVMIIVAVGVVVAVDIKELQDEDVSNEYG